MFLCLGILGKGRFVCFAILALLMLRQGLFFDAVVAGVRCHGEQSLASSVYLLSHCKSSATVCSKTCWHSLVSCWHELV